MKSKLLLLLLLVGHSAYTQVSAESLRQQLDRTADFLKSEQAVNGCISDSTNTLFDIWETILVTSALATYYPPSDTVITRALKWLEPHASEDGFICHNAHCSNFYCIETTALYLQLLCRTHTPFDMKKTGDLLDSLQTDNGSWLVGNPDVYLKKDFVSATAFALNALNTLNVKPQREKAALDFIAARQLADGSWGVAWEYYGIPEYAFWQCMKALRYHQEYTLYYNRAKEFLIASQHENGNWYSPENNASNTISTELQTALALHCLAGEKDSRSRQAYEKGLHFMLSRQRTDGSWDGGRFPIPKVQYRKYEYLFVTALMFELMVAESKNIAPHE